MMFHEDIIRLFKKGKIDKAKDTDVYYYEHYIAGTTFCTFKYIKRLHKIRQRVPKLLFTRKVKTNNYV